MLNIQDYQRYSGETPKYIVVIIDKLYFQFLCVYMEYKLF